MRKALMAVALAVYAAADAAPGNGAYFHHKTVNIPHDEKIDRAGEDAAEASESLLVLADGVGGWANQGVNPGLYSRHLVSQLQVLHKAEPNLSPKQLLVKQNPMTAKLHKGSCTCTIIKIEGPNKISTANVGDSGYSLFRVKDGVAELYYRKKEGQREFNFPFQVGSVGDDPQEVAEEETHDDIQENDIIFAYSDGYGDNVHQPQFQRCFNKLIDPKTNRLTNLSRAADCQARTAYVLGKKENYQSPFQIGALEVGKQFYGGKHDDISVIVAQWHSTGFKRVEFDDAVEYFKEAQYLYTTEDGSIMDKKWGNFVKTEKKETPKEEPKKEDL